MIATILPATGNKPNCFISAGGNVNNYLACAFVLLSFFVDFYMLINHLLKKKNCLEIMQYTHMYVYKMQKDNNYRFK